MNKYSKAIVMLLLMLTACGYGNLGQDCKPDGTCNSTSLVCSPYSNTCRVKTADPPPKKCSYESECFCMTCAEKCGDAGVHLCSYSDTSVWGAKPAICECK